MLEAAILILTNIKDEKVINSKEYETALTELIELENKLKGAE